MSGFNIFPARIEIGQFAGADGKPVKVYASSEFHRALSSLFEFLGGGNGMDAASLAILASFTPEPTPLAVAFGETLEGAGGEIAALRDLLEQTFAQLDAARACVGPLERRIEALEAQTPTTGTGTDWEHPGQIGRFTPNTGAFTRASVGAGTVALPSFYMATETATGFYRIGANNWGFAVLGAKAWEVTAASNFGIGVTPITRLDVAQAGGSRIRWDIAGGTVNSTASNAVGAVYAPHQHNAATHVWTLNGATPKLQIDAAGLVLVNLGASVGGEQLQVSGTAKIYGDLSSNGAFGCNGKSAQTSVALGFAAGDLPTVIVLANNMRAALIANGIGA